MKIENFRSEKRGKRARVAATVRWEDCNRPVQELYFETDEEFAQDLSCNPHAFLVACAIPAMHYGEERVFVDAEICPELRDGLATVIDWFHHWFGPDCKLVRIEAKTRSSTPTLHTPERAGIFFSGGIDSFAALRVNQLSFPPEHSLSIKDGLLVYGFELDEPEAFEHVLHSLSGAAQDAGITLIPVYTNLYLHYKDEDAENEWSFWTYKFQGAALAAVAHAFTQRLTGVSIASTLDIPNLEPEGYLRPFGSHPLLDPNYSSNDLQIRHDGITLSRFAKTKLVADWDVALQNLRVCNRGKLYRPGRLNCGRCEKCVRTMLALLALGVLDQTRAFPHDDVSEEIVLRAISIHGPYMESCFQELIAPLAERGRHDLVRAIEHGIARHYDREPGLKARIKRLDRKYLNGTLARTKRLIFHKPRQLRVDDLSGGQRGKADKLHTI